MEKNRKSCLPHALESVFFFLLFFLLSFLDAFSQTPKPSGKHFAFVDEEFIFTLELVRPGTPILNFINLGRGTFQLNSKDVRLISGVNLYRPPLFYVDTASPKDPMRFSNLQVRPRSSFGLTLAGDLGEITTIDRATIRLGSNQFTLAALDAGTFEILARQIGKISLLSPDFREDFRVLEIHPLGNRLRNLD